MTDQELAAAIRTHPHFEAGWFDNPPKWLGHEVTFDTATECIGRAVRTLLRDNPPWIPAEGEKVRWQAALWTVEHVHGGHAYLFAKTTDIYCYRAPLSELVRP